MNDADIERLAGRMRDALAAEFFGACYRTIEQVSPHCESPIEVLLGATLLLALKMLPDEKTHIVEILNPADEDRATAEFVLMPQYPWQGYRIDWVVKIDGPKQPYIFVECDGHDFHERTKEQAERDRSRDRAIQMAGIPVLRFTGREIYRNPSACGLQIFDMATSLMRSAAR